MNINQKNKNNTNNENEIIINKDKKELIDLIIKFFKKMEINL